MEDLLKVFGDDIPVIAIVDDEPEDFIIEFNGRTITLTQILKELFE